MCLTWQLVQELTEDIRADDAVTRLWSGHHMRFVFVKVVATGLQSQRHQRSVKVKIACNELQCSIISLNAICTCDCRQVTLGAAATRAICITDRSSLISHRELVYPVNTSLLTLLPSLYHPTSLALQ
ncbi:hypothetical protein J6590_012429 [Homalodisca vitripennis]|nr:hypothetical protein J6590_012429 [Homalodisca vitripennis]